MVLEKKKAAALAAVTYYIESEEEMLLAQAAAGRGGVQPVAARPSAAINLWGLSGRQAMMQMRNQMQMRGFHGAHFR